MAGLSVLLETHKNHSGKPQILSKATLLTSPKISSSSSKTVTPRSSFLQRCFLCNRELAEGKDIYMYRGDRAFCSVECRCRQIFMDEDGGANCAKDAAAVRGRRRAVGGGFAY